MSHDVSAYGRSSAGRIIFARIHEYLRTVAAVAVRYNNNNNNKRLDDGFTRKLDVRL